MRLLHDVMFVLLAINTVCCDFCSSGPVYMGTEIVAVYTCDKSCIKKSPMYVNGTRATKTQLQGVGEGGRTSI